MRVSVTTTTCDLSDGDLKQMTQLGVDCIDFGSGSSFPGVKEQGYPDLDALLRLKRRIRSFGLDINRVTLPDLSAAFMAGAEESEKEVDHSVAAINVFAEAGIPIVRQRFAGDTFNHLTQSYKARQRGGALARGESLVFSQTPYEAPTLEAHEQWWERFLYAYGKLVPAVEEAGIKLGMHPSDSPLQGTPFGGLGYRRIMDEFPSKQVGYIYCMGTRAEEGGSSLVVDEINHYGRKGRLFLIHFRNVRGALPTAGAFEEALLDDGDMNMFKLLLELKKVGYDGCLNPDHVPVLEGDSPDLDANWAHSNIGWSYGSIGFAYSIGYIKALLNALNEVTGTKW
ncbi:mannonate dehydratase [Shouchella clausii]|jgi:mannonate dehydratase|uniref:mannonate dehydratase n=1 Tax=Shouchella clausii TaxID=79880 RepID=A0A268RVS2_SHOCL|nr:mannonate dehydratase [Shouchella clausii]MCM3314423.1 mannonate dehydratase [Psychrobacillus sp. MER TA 17]PAD41247.1 mannonate dehydratase [Bacillus sp. 7520-S]SPT79166.1 mannonate dehydratase [Niallia circulans]AST95200.1 mannonate dehydratase [Shouchella clausii]MCR1289677.1 mannonate dehydratase [Shouchella clausii]